MNSNIDREGNVLWLDEERLARKDNGYTPYKNPSNGLGIFNFIKEHCSARPWNLKFMSFVFHFAVEGSKLLKKGGPLSRIYRQIAMIWPDRDKHTAAVVMPLNVDLTDKGEKTVIPLDLIRDALERADFICGMRTCICREASHCEDYPHDLACLMIGEGARTLVRHGIADELTVEEAMKRCDRAAALGLPAHGVWIEVEQMLWGCRNDEMDRLFEICFCCPCCCVGVNLSRNGTDLEKRRFHPVGWTAVADLTKCSSCGLCMSGPYGCPQDAITMGEDGTVRINQETCTGCGICRRKCPSGAIAIKQTMPMRSDMHEYFEKEFNIDVKAWDSRP